MSWYRTGTVTVTKNNALVTGAGTDFVANVSVGDILLGPDRQTYEVATVISATQLTLATPYLGDTLGGQGYAIAPTQSFIRDLALGAASLLNTFGTVRDTIGRGLIEDGSAATPSMRFLNDQDTGYRRVGDNAAALVAGGADRLTWGPFGATVNGRITGVQADGVGVVAPALGALPSGSSGFFGVGQIYGLVIGTNGNTGDTWMQAMRTDGGQVAYNLNLQPSGGNVGIGTVTPQQPLHVSSADTGRSGLAVTNTTYGVDVRLSTSVGVTNAAILYTSTNSPLRLGTNNVERVRLSEDGFFLAGVTSNAGYGGAHRIARGIAQGGAVLGIDGAFFAQTALFYSVNANGYSAAGAAMMVGRNDSTGRSLNLGGTVNASGADYAEYMRKADACGVVAKGQIVGVDGNGKLTDRFSLAHSFLIKSTNPAYVGGDTWSPGPAPTEPLLTLPAAPIEPTGDAATKETLAEFAKAAEAFTAKVAGIKTQHSAAVAKYQADLTAYEAKLEAARQCVDRVAFSGQVPCNVAAGTFKPGDYIIASKGKGDEIVGLVITNAAMRLNPGQRCDAVGKVWRVMEDGRAWCAVLIG